MKKAIVVKRFAAMLVTGVAMSTVGLDVFAGSQPVRQMAVLRVGGVRGDDEVSTGGSGSKKFPLEFELLEDTAKKTPREVTWLGVFTEEAPEVIAAQLSLKSGEGLVVTYVAPESPAAKAGVQKYDVLVELKDQLLVHPSQLAKLIRSQKDGETVKLVFYRESKKQTLSATLGKRMESFSSAPAIDSEATEWRPNGRQPIAVAVQAMHEKLTPLPAAQKAQIEQEVQRSMEEARKAIAETLRRNGSRSSPLIVNGKDLEALVNRGVRIGDDATVIIKKDGNSVKTIVKADETGSCVILANPKKRLIAHDKNGKLLFDGEIETEEQQKKVPAQIWEKVKPMLQQIGPVEDGERKPHAEMPGDQNG